MKTFKALWDGLLIGVSAFSTLLCLGLAVGIRYGIKDGGNVSPGVNLLLVVLVLGCGFFVIRGYTITSDAILVHRLLWNTRLPRTGLQSARVEPNAMRRSIRIFGNGGLFSFTGFYRNKRLGSYRAFVTDRRRTVVLKFTSRTIVLSPESPEEFVRELSGAPA